MWKDFTTTTNGEWFDIVLAFALLPAEFIVFLSPFIFIGRLWTHFSQDWTFRLTGNEGRWKWFSASYMFLAAIANYLINSHETFMVGLAAVEALCGIIMLSLPLAWWGTPIRVDQMRAGPAETATYNE
jgi:hypothetical protein